MKTAVTSRNCGRAGYVGVALHLSVVVEFASSAIVGQTSVVSWSTSTYEEKNGEGTDFYYNPVERDNFLVDDIPHPAYTRAMRFVLAAWQSRQANLPQYRGPLFGLISQIFNQGPGFPAAATFLTIFLFSCFFGRIRPPWTSSNQGLLFPKLDILEPIERKQQSGRNKRSYRKSSFLIYPTIIQSSALSTTSTSVLRYPTMIQSSASSITSTSSSPSDSETASS